MSMISSDKEKENTVKIREEIKDAIWKRQQKAIDDAKWYRSDIDRARLDGIVKGLQIAYYEV